jgi:hypothetical protein
MASSNFLSLLAQSHMESAYFVVVRRGKNASDHSSSHGSLRSLRLALVSPCLPHSLAGSLARPGQRRASLAQHAGARFPDARS